MLKLNGKEFDPHPPAPTLLKLLAFLDKSSDEDLYTRDELARRLGGSKNSIDGVVRDSKAASYREKVGRLVYYGNPKAIMKLRKKLGEQ